MGGRRFVDGTATEAGHHARFVRVMRSGTDCFDTYEITTYRDDPLVVARLDHARFVAGARRENGGGDRVAYRLAWDELLAGRAAQ